MADAGAFPIPPSTRFRGHSHDVPHICVVLEGGFLERDRRSWRDVAPGTLRVSGPARHDIDFSSYGAVCLVLDFDPSDLPRLDRPQFLEHDKSLVAIAKELQRSTNGNDPAARIITNDLTSELLAQVSRRLNKRSSPPPSWLSRVRELAHDSSGTMSVSELAREAGVHRVHLARAFREHYGVPVMHYTQKLRVHAALRLIARDDFPLSRVALEAGFADQSHLTRTVRDVTGSTPGALRSMLHPFKT
jgi:AraC family transcriptional regulator